MVWSIVENNICSCPGLTTDILPTPLHKNIKLLSISNKLHLLAENIAGILPCNEGSHILIIPKFEELQPLEMLAYINNYDAQTFHDYELSSGQNIIGLETLSLQFAKEIKSINCNQLLFRRRLIEEDSKSIKGHVNWHKSILNISRGIPIPIHTNIYKSRTDIIENFILTEASKVAIQYLI